MFTRPNRRRPSLPALVAVPLLALSLAACAPSGEQGADPSRASGSDGGATETSEMMTWQLDYAECMREQGIDVPDPKQEAGGLTSTSQITEDPEAVAAASTTCMEKLGDPPAPSPEEQEAADESFLKWAKEAAQCFRDNGYDMPDPDGSKSLNFPSDAPPEITEECGGGATAVNGSGGQ